MTQQVVDGRLALRGNDIELARPFQQAGGV